MLIGLLAIQHPILMPLNMTATLSVHFLQQELKIKFFLFTFGVQRSTLCKLSGVVSTFLFLYVPLSWELRMSWNALSTYEENVNPHFKNTGVKILIFKNTV